FGLSVGSGSGDGSYAAGTVVPIVADPPPAGQVFDQWSGDVGAVADVLAAATSVTMPAGDVAVTATYRVVPTFGLSVGSGSGDGSYAAGTVVPIVADPPPAGQVFDQWSGDVGAVADVLAAATSVTMPAGDVAVTATYRVASGVVGFTLINADTDGPVGGFDPLLEGAVVNLASLPTLNLNVRANTVPADVGSVQFFLDGVLVRTEGVAPYALAGDSSGDYRPWTPLLGEHTLTAVPGVGDPATITFTVIDQTQVPPIADAGAAGEGTVSAGVGLAGSVSDDGMPSWYGAW
ncbi:MAG: hypothetical protein OEM84_15425, partial [Acidimicrobiia bacterium]|nr:hypothetical protein [Acidimicrobiia bacterium]